MKKNVIVFGSISGLIVSLVMVIATSMLNSNPDFQGSMVLGYASMLVAFSFVFVGIKNFRDKHNNGIISFGKAFKLGLYITLIGSSFYVLTWLVEYYLFIPDFMEKYSAVALKHAHENGASAAEIAKTTSDMEMYKEMYKNPLFVILLTYMEVLPIGLLVTLISAAILKRKEAKVVAD